MDPKIFLDLLDEVLPVGIIALIAVGLYFMKNHQENMEKLYKVTVEQYGISEARLQSDRDNQVSFLHKQIDRLTHEQKELRSEIAQGKDDYRDLQNGYLELHARANSMLNERFDGRASTEEIIRKLEESVKNLPEKGSQEIINRDNQEIRKLKQDFVSLRKSLEQMEKVDEATRDWLQDVRMYSRNRTSLAQQAAQHARYNG